jgi:hypothetical protein
MVVRLVGISPLVIGVSVLCGRTFKSAKYKKCKAERVVRWICHQTPL